MQVVDADGEELDAALRRTSDTRDTTNYVLYHEAESSGPVYIHAYGTRDSEVAANYSLEVHRNASDRFEPNGNISLATKIDPGTYEDLRLSDDESDYFLVDTAAGDTLNVTMTVPKTSNGDQPDNSPDFEFVDAGGNFIEDAAYRTTETRDTISYVLYHEVESDDPVYIHAYGAGDDEVAANYTLSVRRNANDRFEPNGNIDTAEPVSAGTYENLTLLGGDDDYYAVAVDEGGTVNVTMNVWKVGDGDEPDNNPHLELYNSDGETIAFDETSTAPAQETVRHTLEHTAQSDEVVFIRAHGSSDDDRTAQYNLTVRGDIGLPSSVGNTEPTADTSGAYAVEAGRSVELDADASVDPDGTIASTAWTLVSGPGTVDDGTYTAPDAVDSETTATVELTVTDDEGATDSATTTVTVETRSSDNGSTGEHESGVSQQVFDAAAGADGTLSRADVVASVSGYIAGGTVDGVSLSRSAVITLVTYYISQ